jgi:hypothetical protein
MNTVPKKRGRKKKCETEPVEIVEPPVMKKRGRKPKGGKITNKIIDNEEQAPVLSNIILHLKCSLKDIETPIDNLSYNPVAPPEIKTYDNNPGLSMYEYETEAVVAVVNDKIAYDSGLCKNCNTAFMNEDEEEGDDVDINIKDVHTKLREIRIQLHKNALTDKKSACFWCTYEFDNPECYIPKYETDDSISGYGAFCRPECAVGYLMKEDIDDSTKFERYQLLNKIYGKVYNYEKNIKPAPNPFYLLDKFYGNLTIQEYRKLLKTQHMMMVIEKPLTRILPELHDDNDEFIMNMYGTSVQSQNSSGGVYKVKRQSEKTSGPTKNSILKETFGLQ